MAKLTHDIGGVSGVHGTRGGKQKKKEGERRKKMHHFNQDIAHSMEEIPGALSLHRFMSVVVRECRKFSANAHLILLLFRRPHTIWGLVCSRRGRLLNSASNSVPQQHRLPRCNARIPVHLLDRGVSLPHDSRRPAATPGSEKQLLLFLTTFPTLLPAPSPFLSLARSLPPSLPILSKGARDRRQQADDADHGHAWAGIMDRRNDPEDD